MKNYSPLFNSIVLLFITVILHSCVKDTCKETHTYSYFEPVYKTRAEVRANIKSNPPQEIKTPGKIVLLGNYIFLNEINRGIHVIDNSNPSSPQNISFISLPGNVDLAIKGNILYADLYTDLVTLNISNPLHVVITKIVDGVFPDRNYGAGFSADTDKVIIEWKRHDTTYTELCTEWRRNRDSLYLMSVASMGSANNATPVGITGSMARFAITGDYLYTVGDAKLNVFNIASPANPYFLNNSNVDWHIETIYPFKDKLFIGSNNGTFIYDIAGSPSHPARVGQFTHARSCDPVIADDFYAYITLHSGSTCLGYNNQLDIVQLNNLSNAQLVKTYSLTNPQGLSKDGNLLFICDGTAGLKVYDASDVQNLHLLKQVAGLVTYDVIAHNNIALVVAKDGLYQYTYASISNIQLLSKLNISN